MMIDEGNQQEDESDPEDREAKELAASSKVLQDIYGNKIKLTPKWYFENEIAMKERPKLGALQEVPKTPNPEIFGQPKGLDDYYDDYYDE